MSSRSVLFAVSSALLGCSTASSPPPADAGSDGGGDAQAATSTLSGTVKDGLGAPVARAKLEVGTVSVFSDQAGAYTLSPAASGPAVLKVSRLWFTPLEATVMIAPSGATRHDVVLAEIPLKLDPTDVALAESHNRTFDLRTSKVSIAVASPATRRAFDNAVFFKNPALFKEPAGQAPVKPAPAPEITGEGARNFSFPLRSGRNQGQDALDVASIVDNLAATPLDAAAFMTWTPAVKWVGEWDQAKFGDLTAAAAGIRQQDWGSGVAKPQDIERLYVDAATKTLWVEIVFASFVELGPGVTDNDGDGRKEIFAKLGSAHYTAEVADKLAEDYGRTVYNTHGLGGQVSKSLNDLYSQTAAQVERYIGEPYEVAGVGTIKYPFVVLTLLGGFKNVILVGP